MTDNTTLKTSQFGACRFDSISPKTLEETVKAINLTLSFDEALKLSLAVDECVRHLNRYNRARSVGKNAALRLVIHFDKKRIRVIEGTRKRRTQELNAEE